MSNDTDTTTPISHGSYEGPLVNIRVIAFGTLQTFLAIETTSDVNLIV